MQSLFLRTLGFLLYATAGLGDQAPNRQHIPISFERNQGQAARAVQYIARGHGFTALLTPAETRIQFRGEAVAMWLPRSSPAPFEPLDKQQGVANYYVGPRSAWHENIPTWRGVRRRSVYPGIDLTCYGAGQNLEYDFVVAPGADPQRIRLAFNRSLHIDQSGNLAAGNLVHRRPDAWQERNGARVPVESRYILIAGNEAAFQLGAYDLTLPLVIDPVLEVGGFLGGDGEDIATSAAFLSAGSAIVIAGATNSLDWAGAPPRQGGFDAFVTALDSAGRPLFITYLGGAGDNRANAVAAAGSTLSVAGETNSRNFPVMAFGDTSPTLSAFGGGAHDAFLADLDAKSGALLYATYLGGSGDDRATGLAADSAGGVTVTGETTSPNFPVQSALQPTLGGGVDAFVTRYNATRNILFSTYLGGSGDDRSHGIAIGTQGTVFVAGETQSDDFPAVHSLQPARAGGVDAFVASLSADGQSLLFSTYLGGAADDRANAIATGPDGTPWVAGSTASVDFPIAFATQPRSGGATDAFLTHLSADGTTLLSSTYFGGQGNDEAMALAVPPFGDIYIAGHTNSPDFPTYNPLQASFGGGSADAFLIHIAGGTQGAGGLSDLTPALAMPVFSSTFYGGSGADTASGLAVDPNGSAWIAGTTNSPDLPRNLAPQDYHGGASDVFFAKISDPIFAAGNMAVGRNLQLRLDVGLSVLPYGGRTTATIASNDPAKVAFSLDPSQPGSPSIAVPTADSLLALSPIYVQGLDDTGVVTYTLTAPGFLPRTATVTLTPSGFAVTPASFTTTPNAQPVSFRVSTAYLDPVTHLATTGESLKGGTLPAVVSVNSSNPAVGTVAGQTFTVIDGQSALFQPKSPGVTSLSVTAPSGFVVLPGSSATATVLPNPPLQIAGLPVGKDLQVPATVLLSAPAPAAGLAVVISSGDPTRVLVSNDSSQPGQSATTITVPPGESSAAYYIQGLVSEGNVRLTASSDGFNSSSATVTLQPSGFYFPTPPPGTTIILTTPDLAATVAPGTLDPVTLAPVQAQAVRPGLPPVQVAVSSSDTRVAAIAASPLVFHGGDTEQNASIHAAAPGLAVVSLAPPSGFSTPSSQQKFNVQVILPAITLRGLVTTYPFYGEQDLAAGLPFLAGKNLIAHVDVGLTAPAPTGGMPVTLTSSDPSRLSFSAGAQVTVQIPEGTTSGTIVGVQALDDLGTVQVTASAPGFTSDPLTVTLAQAAFIIGGGTERNFQLGAGPDFLTALWPMALDSLGVPQYFQRALAAARVEVRSSSPEVAIDAASPHLISAWDFVNLKAYSVGTTILTVIPPSGFVTPSQSSQMKVIVWPTSFYSTDTSFTVAEGHQLQINVFSFVAVPSGQTLTITSSDPGKVLLNPSGSSPGAASVALGSGNQWRFVVNALAGDGTVTLTLSAPGLDDGQFYVYLTGGGG